MLLFLLFSSCEAEKTFYAIKGGLLSHSTGPISSGKESGIDLHAKLLFTTKILKAYPGVGTDINLNGDTSFLYGGLSRQGKFFKHLLLGAFFGLAVHNGDLDASNSDKRQFGTRLLFREAIDIGFYMNKEVSISLMYDHYSNAGLANKRNQGNDNIGIRVSYYY